MQARKLASNQASMVTSIQESERSTQASRQEGNGVCKRLHLRKDCKGNF